MAKLGRLSFFVVISKTGNNGNDEHSDLDKIVPCYVFQNTTSPHFILEEGKKMTLPPYERKQPPP
jgi:hypothetical protein